MFSFSPITWTWNWALYVPHIGFKLFFLFIFLFYFLKKNSSLSTFSLGLKWLDFTPNLSHTPFFHQWPCHLGGGVDGCGWTEMNRWMRLTCVRQATKIYDAVLKWPPEKKERNKCTWIHFASADPRLIAVVKHEWNHLYAEKQPSDSLINLVVTYGAGFAVPVQCVKI